LSSHLCNLLNYFYTNDTKQSLTYLEMIINPHNVVRLLLASLSSIYLTKTPINETEIELKENYTKIIIGTFFTIMIWK